MAGTILLGLVGSATIIETNWTELPLKVYGGIFYLSIATTAVSFYLIKFASMHLPSAKVMAYTYLIPAFVVVQVALTGSSWPSISILAGIAVIAAATLILQRSR